MKLQTLSILFFLSIHSYSQTAINTSTKVATFCKVWGFLKYHHPLVAKGRYDWDRAFIENLRTMEQLNTKEQINQFYYEWISGLGKLKKNVKRTLPTNAILSNYDFSWLQDSTLFTSQVADLLLQVRNNSRAKNHYVKRKFLGLAAASYVNEKMYQDSTYPSGEMRLLTLARFWNIVNYFYPYKYLADEDWQDVIREFVPKFFDADNIKTYQRTLLELFAKLNDSHTGFNPQLYHGSYYKIPPFNNKIINDKIIVLNPYNDSTCMKNDIQYGDVILKINNINVKSMIDYYSKFISASNYASLCRQLAPQWIWTDMPDSVVISFERNGNIFDKILPEYSVRLLFKDALLQKEQSLFQPGDSYKVLDHNIAYIDLGKIKSKKETKLILRKIKNTSATILDIRNYPNSAIFQPVTNFFCSSRKPFAKYAKQSIKYPGTLIWAKTTYCGKNRANHYKGKVAVLIDESTISFAEHFTMALKTIPNVVLVGSHTAGADGSNHKFVLPGNITTSFSNEAVYYPDGSQTQRRGIVPDITILPTIEGIRSRKDEVLEKAIEILCRK